MTPTLNFDILALSSQVSVVDICWAHTAVGQNSLSFVDVVYMYIVIPFPEHCVYWTCGMELQKLSSSCMFLNKLGLFDQVTQASLVRVLSVHLLMADSPLAAESRSTMLNNQPPSCYRACLPFPHRFSSPCCVGSPTVQPFCLSSLVSWARMAS